MCELIDNGRARVSRPYQSAWKGWVEKIKHLSCCKCLNNKMCKRYATFPHPELGQHVAVARRQQWRHNVQEGGVAAVVPECSLGRRRKAGASPALTHMSVCPNEKVAHQGQAASYRNSRDQLRRMDPKCRLSRRTRPRRRPQAWRPRFRPQARLPAHWEPARHTGGPPRPSAALQSLRPPPATGLKYSDATVFQLPALTSAT